MSGNKTLREEIARIIDPKAWELRDAEPSIPKHKNRHPEALDWERYREHGCAPSLAKTDTILALPIIASAPAMHAALEMVRRSTEWSCMEREVQDAVEAALALSHPLEEKS